MTVMANINLRSRTGYLHGQPTRKLSLEGAAASFKGQRESVSVTNLSKAGMLLETSAPLSVGEPLMILFPEGETCNASIVWAADTIFACEFEKALSIATIRKVQLQSPPEPRAEEEAATSETLGARIKRLRRERGFGVDHFASYIGVSRPTLWKWEKGTVSPRQNMVQTIAKALGVPEKELLYGSRPEVVRHDASQLAAFDVSSSVIASKKVEIAKLIGVDPNRVRILIET
ncbi:helix-turn-helix domain-containing protein [Novosphingobium mathurense]|uniref:Transcriptional regulator, contains XRE-family HTH domain n=1 Tax=Novosphingobium mathurense TaxID=428990 RepID=A0A1U6HNV3_9SPHN|nr:helix-turn-helix transcriptional regulator [Novosphingobium mathurense]SLJ97455.1 Transcriptional regulator, contains XRE-family HTH domain [Novosphingobium mathurense]